jgi:hypothetical protein
MADPQGSADAATAPEPTPKDAPQDAGNGDLTDDARKAVEGAEKPDEVREILSAASRRARQAEGELKAARQELSQLQDAGKSELEKATARAERAEAHAAELERTVLVSAVATKYDLHPELVPRLRGATEEELEADAKALAKQFPRTVDEPPPDLGAGARGAATAPGSRGFSDTIRRQAQRRR